MHDGGSLSVIRVAGASYMKANAAFLDEHEHVPSAVLEILANRWLRVEGSEADGLNGLSVRTLGKCLLHEPGSLVVDGVTDLNGQPTVAITNKGDLPGSTPAKFNVAATGQPRLLRAVATGNERPGGHPSAECAESGDAAEAGAEETLSSYDEPMNIQAPPGALTVKQLTKQATRQLGP
jgi:hypothetical protein